MACTITCKAPSPAQAHCAAEGCHRTFGGLSGFDRHRRNGRCLDPSAVGLSETGGVWRMPASESRKAWLAQIADSDSRPSVKPQSDETSSPGGRDTLGNSEALDSLSEGSGGDA